MKRIARFEKVSLQQFVADYETVFRNKINVEEVYETVSLPQRATTGSAGYDFLLPVDICLPAGESITIPTGIRAFMEEGWTLLCYPKSGLGFKYRLQLDNTVGVIDGDYCHSENEGHIMIKLTNDNRQGKTLSLSKGKGFAQGVFMPFGITMDDDVTAKRNGGFGSTQK